jgi:hypothetical protein
MQQKVFCALAVRVHFGPDRMIEMENFDLAWNRNRGRIDF